jgi:menaquinone-dependent protoporphyrinogen oxidase
MNNKVLIAFATKCGATEEAAKRITDTLGRKFGLTVDLVNLGREAHPNFSQYGSIVVGSGIRMGKWYKEALQFLKNDFQGRNLALFVCSMNEGGKPETYPVAVERLKKVSEEHSKAKHVTLGVFGGRMRFMGRVTADNLVEDKVDAWAENLQNTKQLAALN